MFVFFIESTYIIFAAMDQQSDKFVKLQHSLSKSNLEEYEVKDIVGRREKMGTLQYQVHWKNYPLNETTWQPLKNLKNSMMHIKKYQKSLLRKPDSSLSLNKNISKKERQRQNVKKNTDDSSLILSSEPSISKIMQKTSQEPKLENFQRSQQKYSNSQAQLKSIPSLSNNVQFQIEIKMEQAQGEKLWKKPYITKNQNPLTYLFKNNGRKIDEKNQLISINSEPFKSQSSKIIQKQNELINENIQIPPYQQKLVNQRPNSQQRQIQQFNFDKLYAAQENAFNQQKLNPNKSSTKQSQKRRKLHKIQIGQILTQNQNLKISYDHLFLKKAKIIKIISMIDFQLNIPFTEDNKGKNQWIVQVEFSGEIKFYEANFAYKRNPYSILDYLSNSIAIKE